MSPLRILMVNKFHYIKGGSETYHFAVGESLESMGYEVAWFAMEDPSNLPCEQSRYFVSATDYSGRTGPLRTVKDGLSLIYSAEAKRKFEELLESFKPDVIHLNLVHRQLTFSILDASYLRENVVPVVYTAHDYIPICPACTMVDGNGEVCDDCLSGDFQNCVRKHCVKGSRMKSALAAEEAKFLHRHGSYRKIDQIIAPSLFMREKLIEGGFPAEQVIHMQNFAKDKVSDDCQLFRERCFLSFGRLSKEKGIDVLLDAFDLAARRLPDEWNLVIAGAGPEEEAIRSWMSSSNFASRIVMTGKLRKDEMRSYVEKASFSIACSRCRENMPYSIVESFAAGTPVIGSKIGGIPELIEDGVTGFLCEPGNADDLARCMIKAAMLDSSKIKRMRINCRNYVISRCDADNYMRELVALYKQLIHEKSKN